MQLVECYPVCRGPGFHPNSLYLVDQVKWLTTGGGGRRVKRSRSSSARVQDQVGLYDSTTKEK